MAKYIPLAIIILAGVTPIIVAFNQHGWNLQSLVTPIYSPPRLDYSLEMKGTELFGQTLLIVFDILNSGEIAISVNDLRGGFIIAGADGAALPVKLVKPVDLPPGGRENMKLRLTLTESAIMKLAQSVQTEGRVRLNIKGELLINVLGSRVTVPLEASTTLTLDQLKDLIQR